MPEMRTVKLPVTGAVKTTPLKLMILPVTDAEIPDGVAPPPVSTESVAWLVNPLASIRFVTDTGRKMVKLPLVTAPEPKPEHDMTMSPSTSVRPSARRNGDWVETWQAPADEL